MNRLFFPGNSPEDAKAMARELEELIKHPEQWINLADVVRELEEEWKNRDKNKDKGP